ncbi:hypothetical protein WN55_05998 [Dufourea novaeangliae]|uniref:Uncharacterized protein n=1 Tax=Dufourea novaeangliae TaxID=178035 RepID=A0A154PNI6_DUFNO|nr:hypothetical protein WN55_05998 [Dufourea novaeangliae]
MVFNVLRRRREHNLECGYGYSRTSNVLVVHKQHKPSRFRWKILKQEQGMYIVRKRPCGRSTGRESFANDA